MGITNRITPGQGPEPWLRGTITDTHPAIAPVLYSFAQAREDLRKWTEGLSLEQIWTSPQGIAPVGFHLRHIAGSIDRLLTYALGRKLDERQTTELRKEMEPGASWEELFSGLEKALENGERVLRDLDPGVLHEPRFVGRRQLPTTLIGLLVHVAEHTQRHVGQAIVTAKLVRQPGPGTESAKTNNPGAEDIGR